MSACLSPRKLICSFALLLFLSAFLTASGEDEQWQDFLSSSESSSPEDGLKTPGDIQSLQHLANAYLDSARAYQLEGKAELALTYLQAGYELQIHLLRVEQAVFSNVSNSEISRSAFLPTDNGATTFMLGLLTLLGLGMMVLSHRQSISKLMPAPVLPFPGQRQLESSSFDFREEPVFSSPTLPPSSPSATSSDEDSAEETDPMTITQEDKDWITHLEQLIRTRFDFRVNNVSTLAEAVHMSPRHLRRKVKLITGKTTSQLVKTIQLEAARSFMKNGMKGSIADVAFQFGFTNQSTFSTQFRQAYGMSPGAFLRESQCCMPV